MATIPLIPPIPHKYQPGVVLDSLAVAAIRVTGGDTIDNIARMEVDMRPYCKITSTEGVVAYIPDPEPGPAKTYLIIEDVYALVAQRAQAGDFKPLQALELLVTVIGEEYLRRNGK